MANCDISKKTFILCVDIANYLLRASEIMIDVHEYHFPFPRLLFMDLFFRQTVCKKRHQYYFAFCFMTVNNQYHMT